MIDILPGTQGVVKRYSWAILTTVRQVKTHLYCLEWQGWELETLPGLRYSAECFMGIDLHVLLNINYCFLISPQFYSLLRKK